VAVDQEQQKARRPRDRRTQIAERAGELFAERGFHSVKMDDIAEAAGITARAIYRHYENKQDLLSSVVLGEQSPLIEVIEDLARSSPDTVVLRDGLARLVEAILDNRHLSILWQREARHLDEADFKLLRDRTKWLAEEYRRLFVQPVRPDLGDAAADLRALAVASITSSPAYFDVAISRSRLVRELVDAAERAILAPAAGDAARPRTGDPRHAHGSRREQLIASAVRAFRRNGYAGVSIDEIGSEVGVVGPALYRYFDNKADILVAAITRFYEWRALETLRALEEEPQSDKVVARLIDRYVHLAVEATDLLAVSLTERLFLPAELRDRFDRVQAENLAEWQRWLIEARPDLDAQRAAVLVHVARTVIDDSVRTPRLRRNPAFEADLASVTHAALGI
jgi:TetR/AcrR family transcriptional regulator, mce3 operon repressor